MPKQTEELIASLNDCLSRIDDDQATPQQCEALAQVGVAIAKVIERIEAPQRITADEYWGAVAAADREPRERPPLPPARIGNTFPFVMDDDQTLSTLRMECVADGYCSVPAQWIAWLVNDADELAKASNNVEAETWQRNMSAHVHLLTEFFRKPK